MKNLNQKETSSVSGAFDGIYLGGNCFISNTGWFTRTAPLRLPTILAFTGGYALLIGLMVRQATIMMAALEVISTIG